MNHAPRDRKRHRIQSEHVHHKRGVDPAMLKHGTATMLVLLMLVPGIVPAGEHWIAPVETDTAITGNPVAHLALRDTGVPPLGSLLLFFPGTNATPADYTLFARTVRQRGTILC